MVTRDAEALKWKGNKQTNKQTNVKLNDKKILPTQKKKKKKTTTANLSDVKIVKQTHTEQEKKLFTSAFVGYRLGLLIQSSR